MARMHVDTVSRQRRRTLSGGAVEVLLDPLPNVGGDDHVVFHPACMLYATQDCAQLHGCRHIAIAPGKTQLDPLFSVSGTSAPFHRLS